MLTFSTCKRVQAWVDAAVRSELDEADQRLVATHIADCGACARVHEQAKLAHQVVRQALRSGAMELPFSDEQLADMRTVTLAAIGRVANESAVAPVVAAWRGSQGRAVFSGLAAASVAALALLAGPSLMAPQHLAPAPAGDSVIAAQSSALAGQSSEFAGADVSISTSTTSAGTRLSWEREGTYRVVRSDRPNLRGGEISVAVVCGTSWTDMERPNGLVYYRVIAEAQSCPPDHA